MRTPFIIPLIAALAAPALAQPAQKPSESEGQEIVVQGNRISQQQVDSFVNALTDVRVFGQISRFDWAVCPKALGLSDRQNAAVEARMRAVAKAADIPVGDIGCKANVLVAVAKDKDALIRSIETKNPGYFDAVPVRERLQLKRGGAPAAAWHLEGKLDADGVEVPRDVVTGQYIVERTDMPSRISTTTRPHFLSAVVVVDLDSLSGLTVTQLADYAAMRTFATVDPSRLDASEAPTILNILEAPMDSAVPITLTAWDLAYLKALYSSEANRFAGQQRHEISKQMAKDLATKPKERH